ncbi:VOC family protein [Mycobacterium botniense]|uniref:VOC family protein n=1 Tax=Mycobacterium botniense TaxID=84962 RepID=A0A7I9XXH9_9MYCO|nr:VOC family protein [Mycobacterium botniense]GFG74488.1 VOC family protein [Mycobacterium botniense]
MARPGPIAIANFSHVCVGVSDIERSLAFYTGVLGMDVVFDVELDGAGLDAVTGMAGGKGRMVGGLIGGMMVELLSLGDVSALPEGPHLGYTNISFRVEDLDATYTALQRRDDVRITTPVEIAGLRMFFVYDPDATPIELIELPSGARTTDQLWRPPA